jgi:hypothetical protein
MQRAAPGSRWNGRNVPTFRIGKRAAADELIKEIAEACAAEAEPLSDARVGLVPKANH